MGEIVTMDILPLERLELLERSFQQARETSLPAKGWIWYLKV
jgi:hypothetical protein